MVSRSWIWHLIESTNNLLDIYLAVKTELDSQRTFYRVIRPEDIGLDSLVGNLPSPMPVQILGTKPCSIVVHTV